MRELRRYETIFLLAILRLPGNAYGVTIRAEVAAPWPCAGRRG